ncbi:MAG: hypothetical protein KAU95_00100, partial [Candidatus Aenigmarchaeota archaeon]|nr:hypothetical protein [Candidatus Aenigmarchaeota archaeon]
MNKNSLNKSLIEFEQRIKDNLDLISDINELNSTNTVLNKSQVNQIIELVFLKIYVSWEIFLEDVFIKLILISKNNYKITAYLKPRDYSHALEMLKENKPFLDWTKVDNVMNRSKYFFKKGFPIFNNLYLIKTELTEMKTIRNNIVHMSQKVQKKFKDL